MRLQHCASSFFLLFKLKIDLIVLKSCYLNYITWQGNNLCSCIAEIILYLLMVLMSFSFTTSLTWISEMHKKKRKNITGHCNFITSDFNIRFRDTEMGTPLLECLKFIKRTQQKNAYFISFFRPNNDEGHWNFTLVFN